MKKEVNMCDSCDKSIAILKCGMCDGDVCKPCAKAVRVREPYGLEDAISFLKLSNLNSTNMNSTIICKKCIKNLNLMIRDLTKMERDDQKIFVDEILSFINRKLPPLITAHKI